MRIERRRHNIHERLDHLFFLLWKRDERINRKLEKLMSDQDDLVAAVARVQGVAASVRTALTELSKKVAALQNNQQAKELAASINASVDDIAAAVDENPDPDPTD